MTVVTSASKRHPDRTGDPGPDIQPAPTPAWRLFYFELYPIGSFLVVISVIFPAFLWAPQVAGTIVLVLASLSATAAAFVLSVTPPLPPVSTLSALHSRLAWLGRFIVGGIVLVAGIMLARLFDSLPADAVPVAAATFALSSIPAGIFLFACILLADLSRISAGKREEAVRDHLTLGTGWRPTKIVGITAHLAAGLSQPTFLASWACLALLVWYFVLQ